VYRLLEIASNPDSIGWTIGFYGLLRWDELDVPSILTHQDQRYQVCGKSFVAGCYSRDKMGFLTQLPVSAWTPLHAAAVASCLPFDKEIWDWVDAKGDNARIEYWRLSHNYFSSTSVADVERATKSLINVGRPYSAIDVLYSALHRNVQFGTELIADVLESALFNTSSEPPNESQNIGYEIQQLIKALQKLESFDRLRLARIEWGFLPLLQRETSNTTPDTLVDAIKTNPEFFVEVLRKLFRGENEPAADPTATEDDWLAADRAFELIENLATLPGTSASGELDLDYLEDWINTAHAAAIKSGHSHVFHRTLGEIFARATRRNVGENWPSPELSTLMQKIGADDFFAGFISGVINSRGVTMRDPFDGGTQERALSTEFNRLSDVARTRSLKLSDAFQTIAANYEEDARREDAEALRVRLGR
jgi:hypothetical protein